MVATTTALIAMSIASAAGSAAKAKIESNAAKKATSAQQSSIDQSLALQRQLWGQQQQMHAPYANAGAASANMLGALMMPPGSPGGYRPGMDWRQPPPGSTLTPNNPGLTPGSTGGGSPLSSPMGPQSGFGAAMPPGLGQHGNRGYLTQLAQGRG